MGSDCQHVSNDPSQRIVLRLICHTLFPHQCFYQIITAPHFALHFEILVVEKQMVVTRDLGLEEKELDASWS